MKTVREDFVLAVRLGSKPDRSIAGGENRPLFVLPLAWFL